MLDETFIHQKQFSVVIKQFYCKLNCCAELCVQEGELVYVLIINKYIYKVC